ncbi:MAG: hypothetical protein ACLP7Q_20925 [Isosphaeraceae bacterium]
MAETNGSAAQETELDQELVRHLFRTILAGALPHSLPSVILASRWDVCVLLIPPVRVAVVERLRDHRGVPWGILSQPLVAGGSWSGKG